jgi:rhomboid protease GluP
MAFGIPPQYSVEFPLEGLTTDQFLMIVQDVTKKLDWDVSPRQGGFVAYTKFRRSRNETIILHVEGGLVSVMSESMSGQFIDLGRNKKNIDEFIHGYDELRASISTEELTARTSEFISKNIAPDETGSNQHPVDTTEKSKGILSLFLPVKGYSVTPVVIDLNILVFIFMLFSGVSIMNPTTLSLLRWGANFRPYTLDGQPWRLFTNVFLHVGILHLLFNMYALLFIGVLLERRLGSWRFGIAYIITGLSASVASLYWHPMTVSAGASGAIFGMYGVFLAMLTTNLIEKTQRKPLLTSIALFVGYNLLNGVNGAIDSAAHIGGLVSGLILGYAFCPGMMNTGDKRLYYGLPAFTAIALLGLSSWVYMRISRDIVQYDKEIKSFASTEIEALQIFNMPHSTPKDALLLEIRNNGLIDWDKDKNLMIKLDKLNLPDEIHKRNKKLIAYCDFRIASYKLIYKSIDEDTRIYDDEIKSYTHSIDSLIGTLKHKK